MPREKHLLGKEKAGTGWRYRKMFRGKTWTSKVYPSLTRQTRSEAWQDFTAFREKAQATAAPNRVSFFLPDGKTLDENAIASSGLTEKEVSREAILQLCQNAYRSLADLMSIAGDHEASHELLSKSHLLDANQTLSFSELVEVYRYINSFPAWKLTEHALPRIRKKQDSSLLLKVLAEEYVSSYAERAKRDEGSYGQAGLVKSALDVFTRWFGAERSMENFQQADWKHFSAYLRTKTKSQATAHSYQKAVGMFLRYLPTEYPELANCHSANLSSSVHRITMPRKEPVTFTPKEVRTLLEHASERTRLYLLLMLNCGMYQQDISDLKVSEIDFEKGRIIRARSKTRKARKTAEQPFLFNWPIWQTTLELLRKHSAPNGISLQSANGGSLVTYTGKWRHDAIRSAYQRVVTKLKRNGILPKDWNKTLKSLRKTGANLVSQCPTPEIAVFFLQYLNQSKVAQGHYLQSGQPHARFDEAVRYIGQQLGQEPLPTAALTDAAKKKPPKAGRRKEK